MNKPRIAAFITALSISLSLSVETVVCADSSSDYKIDSEMSYVLEVLPNYLTANNIEGTDIWIGDPFSLVNVANNELVGDAFLVFNGNDYVGLIEVTMVNSSYYSSFITDEYKDIQTAYFKDEDIALYYDDEILCVAVDNSTLSSPDSTDYSLNYQNIQLNYDYGNCNGSNTKGVLYNKTIAVASAGNTTRYGHGICWCSALTSKYNYINNTNYTANSMYTSLDNYYYPIYNEHPYGITPWITRVAAYLGQGNTEYSPLDYLGVYNRMQLNDPFYCGVVRTGGAHAVLLSGMILNSDGTGTYKFVDPNYDNMVTVYVTQTELFDGSQLVYVGGYTYTWNYCMY